jgi:hypothetical protein
MDEVYKKFPEVISYITVENGNIVFDFDETKIPLEHIMVILNQITQEYMKALAEQSMNNQQNQ